jgi:hypothetical protein
MEGAVNLQTDRLLKLDAPQRVVSWRTQNGFLKRHTFRPFTTEDCEGYFSRVHVERVNGARIVEPMSACMWLYSQCVIHVEGYSLVGGAAIMTLRDWQRNIPRRDQVRAIDKALHIVKSTDADPEIEPGTEVVSLDAYWTESDREIMPLHKGLVHRFAQPLTEHETRYEREVVMFRENLHPSTYLQFHDAMVSLYDDLIVAVEGYAARGVPLDKPEKIVGEMDPFHKHVAAIELFSFTREYS